jgi:hypothetical protein
MLLEQKEKQVLLLQKQELLVPRGVQLLFSYLAQQVHVNNSCDSITTNSYLLVA